jgi:hypothetical protein
VAGSFTAASAAVAGSDILGTHAALQLRGSGASALHVLKLLVETHAVESGTGSSQLCNHGVAAFSFRCRAVLLEQSPQLAHDGGHVGRSLLNISINASPNESLELLHCTSGPFTRARISRSLALNARQIKIQALIALEAASQ